MSSFMWLHQQTGSVFLSFSGPCLAAVSVVCVAQSVFPLLLFSHSRGALTLAIQFPPMSEPLRAD